MAKEIQLTRGFVSIVDDADFDWLSQWKWQAFSASDNNERKYAGRHEGNRSAGFSTMLMHRQIMAAPEGSLVDHKNRNRLDNRRENLRFATRAQNAQNSNRPIGQAGFRGVTRLEETLFRAQITADRVPYLIGCYKTALAAAHAYNLAAKKLHGEFAVVNPLDSFAESELVEKVSRKWLREAEAKARYPYLMKRGAVRFKL